MSTQELEDRIEQLVREHIAAVHAATNAAVARAFVASEARPTVRAGQQTQRTARRTPGPRRSTAEVEGLAERFWAAVLTFKAIGSYDE